MDHPQQPQITAIEWFAGASGNYQGLRRVIPSLRVVAACEIEAYAVANLVAKAEGGWLHPFPCWTDCKTFPFWIFRGLIDLFIASYPCQGYSHAGQRKGAADPRFLWPWVLRAIIGIRPRRVFLENVEGHITLGLSTVLSDLEAAGYRCTWGIFSAEECGASHRRKRVFILGERIDPVELADAERQPGCPQWGPESRGGDCAGPQQVPMPRGACEAMAHASCVFLHRNQQQPGGRCESPDCGCAVAHIERRWPEQPQGIVEKQRQRIIHGGKTMADAGINGRIKVSEISQRRKSIAPAGCEAVAYASLAGLQGIELGDALQSDGGGEETYGPASELREFPFPPGPGLGADGVIDDIIELFGKDPERAFQRFEAERANTLAWQRVLEIDPSLEPALCRMAHGLAHRVDRLRLTGNGVVPDTAALAWFTLDRKLRGMK